MMNSSPVHYLRRPGLGHPTEVWRIDERTAEKAGIEPGQNLFRYEACQGETAWEAIARYTPWPKESFVPLERDPGTYHPRIARPLLLANDLKLWSESGVVETTHILGCRAQLIALVRQLRDICRTVEPAEKTLGVYGHNIRNLLILSATEVEMHWRGVLNKNGKSGDRMSTKDYVQLAEIMRLREYLVGIRDFPNLQSFKPFERWGLTGAATQDLPWYVAYHAVKHDRENEFERGTLGAAIQALVANAIMLVAQFGMAAAFDGELSNFFRFDQTPSWPEGDGYLEAMDGSGWTSVNHPAIV